MEEPGTRGRSVDRRGWVSGVWWGKVEPLRFRGSEACMGIKWGEDPER